MGVSEKIIDKIAGNHHIKIEESLCSCFRTPKSNCSLCVDVCPANAIEISDKGAEIKEGCIDCGICYSACPNAVFRIEGKDDRKIISEIKDKIKRKSTSQPLNFSISCERGDEKADLILPCLSRLTEVLLLEPILSGVQRIEILQPSCQECPLAKAFSHIDTIAQRALHIYELLGIYDALHITHCSFSSSEPRTPDSELKPLSRREFFGAVKTKAVEITVASLPDIEHKNEKNEGVFRDIALRQLENPKRTLLLKYIQGIIQSPNFKLKAINRVDIPSKDAILAEIEITPECTGCGVCAKLCPTGAIISRETEDNLYLGFRADLCTNCEVCLKTCMYNAIRIKERVSLNLLLEQTESRLFEAREKICPICRMGFIGSDSEFCSLCIDRAKKQQTMIKKMIIEGVNSEQD